jgi:hypothetical protein
VPFQNRSQITTVLFQNRSQIIRVPFQNRFWFHRRYIQLCSALTDFLTNSSLLSGTRGCLDTTPSDIALRIAASILDLSVVPGMCVFSLSASTPDSNSEAWSDSTTSGASPSDSCVEHNKLVFKHHTSKCNTCSALCTKTNWNLYSLRSLLATSPYSCTTSQCLSFFLYFTHPWKP